jgi:hypothetical protein
MPNTRSKAHERITFTGIPMDYCPRCKKKPGGVVAQSKRPPVPVAVSGLGTEDCVIRYVCSSCRLIWDCFYDMKDSDDFFNTGPFEDETILWREGLESHPTPGINGVPFPAGPKKILKDLEAKR